MKELIDLVAACPTHLQCRDFHHSKKDQHDSGEDCEPLNRYYAALMHARHRIAKEKK